MEGVNGLRILSTFGIDASRLTDWIIVLSCLFPACLLLAFALLHLRMPRARRLARATAEAKPAAAASAGGGEGPV